MGTFILSILLIVCILSDSVDAHGYLLKPHADWRSDSRPHCRIGGPEDEPKDSCKGPCISWSSWFLNRTAVVTTWERGEKVNVRWTRNNHENGFVRLALVPRNMRMSFDAHNKYVFHYSCWSSNRALCDADHCGTDDDIYQTDAIVPPVPDGHYILGWTWYGGYGGSDDRRYNFGDYWSCANIWVSGGSDVVSEPPFDTRFNSGTKEDACVATTNKLGECVVEPCSDSDVPNGPRMWRPFGFPQPNVSPTPTPSLWPIELSPEPSEIPLFPIGIETPMAAQSVQKPSSMAGPSTAPSRVPPSSSPISFVTSEPLMETPSPSVIERQTISPSAQPLSSPSACPCPAKSTDSTYISMLRLQPLDARGRRTGGGQCLCDGDIISIAKYMSGVTIDAVCHGDHIGVRFYIDDDLHRTEMFSPYAIEGNIGEMYYAYDPPLGRPTRLSAESIVVDDSSTERLAITVTFTG